MSVALTFGLKTPTSHHDLKYQAMKGLKRVCGKSLPILTKDMPIPPHISYPSPSFFLFYIYTSSIRGLICEQRLMIHILWPLNKALSSHATVSLESSALSSSSRTELNPFLLSYIRAGV
jgi:hypothetical protein